MYSCKPVCPLAGAPLHDAPGLAPVRDRFRRTASATMQSGKVRAISSAVGRQAAPLAHGLNVNLSNPARSARGGFSTKIHLRTEAEGRPLAFELTGGEAHGVNGYRALMELCDGVSAEGLVVPGEALFEHHHALELSSPFPDEERAGPEADAPLRFWTSAIERQCGSSCPSCSSSSGGS